MNSRTRYESLRINRQYLGQEKENNRDIVLELTFAQRGAFVLLERGSQTESSAVFGPRLVAKSLPSLITGPTLGAAPAPLGPLGPASRHWKRKIQ